MNEPTATRPSVDPIPYAPVLPVVAENELESTANGLPRDHPAWQRDALSISARARAIIATMKPIIVRVLTFWDHQLRHVPLGGRSITIDPSGCYRLH